MTLLLALTGCTDPTGIWLYALSGSILECTETITENYSDGAVPGGTTGTSDWTITYDETVSPELFFGQIVKHSRTEGVLVVGDAVYPGTLAGGIWTFTWTNEESSTSSESHADGYTYTHDVVGTITTSWTMDIGGDNAEGNVEVVADTTDIFGETDEWEPNDVGIFGSQVPSDNYLQDSDGFGVTNNPDDADCSSSNCELTVQAVCSGTAPFTATWAGFLEEDAYEGVSTAGQDAGL